MGMASDWRLIIAFTEPPERFRFSLAESGSAWFRRIEGRDQAIGLAKHLAELGIHGVIKKADPPKPRAYSPRLNGLGAIKDGLPYRRGSTRTSGFSAASRNPRNARRHGRGRRGM
jgi:hypothetical protein